MSTGAMVVTAIFGAFGLLMVLQLVMVRATLAQRGKPAPPLPGELGELVRHDALLFFHSPGCQPCRVMKPHVEELAAQDARVRLVDVSRDIQTARAFKVMGTPTLIAVHGGTIAEARVGVVPVPVLQELAAALS